MSDPTDIVRAVGITKRYGNLEALRDVSLTASRGEILALVGPNGAGKTTLLKILVGLLTPTSGEAWIGGSHVIRQPLEVKRILAFLPDQPFLYEELTVAEMLGFIGAMYQIGAADLQARAERLLAAFGLQPVLHSRVRHLSYGMKSRLALIMSLLHEPQVLILDEPFFGLDPQTLRLMKRLLLERAKGGMTIVLSTHQLAVVEDVARRIAILLDGRLVAIGSRDELTQRHGGAPFEDIFFQLTGLPPEAPS